MKRNREAMEKCHRVTSVKRAMHREPWWNMIYLVKLRSNGEISLSNVHEESPAPWAIWE